VVLARIVLAGLLLTGCKLSLFAEHGGGDDVAGDANGSDDGMVQSSCGANCLGDVAADFCGTKWQCLDDHRDRTWAAMTGSGNDFAGANPANKIAKGSDGILISTAGMSDSADPAVAFTSTSNQVIKLTINVDIPAGAADQTVRLYRNSREDELFTQAAAGGGNVATEITVDALKDDRFLLAIAPTGAGAADVKVKFFVNGTGMAFPKECQLGLQFSGTAPTTPPMPNACGAMVTSRQYDINTQTATDVAPTYTMGPFPEMGNAGDLTPTHYYKGADIMNRAGDTTTQFWMRQDAQGTEDAVIFSDDDLDDGQAGGLTVFRLNSSGNIGAETCINATSTTLDFAGMNAPYPAPSMGWHFVRVVHTNGQVKLCVDGKRVTSYALATGKMQSMYVPYIGKNVIWTPSDAYYDGAVDDVRVLSTALPCN
jgi:hypothetical protein